MEDVLFHYLFFNEHQPEFRIGLLEKLLQQLLSFRQRSKIILESIVQVKNALDGGTESQKTRLGIAEQFLILGISIFAHLFQRMSAYAIQIEMCIF